MKEIIRDNAKIDYQVSGKGKTTLLFVHGSYLDHTYWKDQVEYFEKNYKVVTLDLPGHGESGKDRKNWSVRGFAADVITLVDELDLKNVILIGHSLAGDINLMAATSHPELFIGFIGVECFKAAATPLSENYQQQAEIILENVEMDYEGTNEDYARMALLTEKTPKSITDRIVKAYRHSYQPMGKQLMPEVFFSLSQAEKELLPELKLKLYLVNVDYMPTNVDALKKNAVNGYKVYHMKGTSHYPMLENPGELNEMLEKAVLDISGNL